MKAKRLQMIVEIVNTRVVTTQEQLQEYLHKAGYDVTQATISRDIRELRLVKIIDGGNYRYAVAGGADDGVESRFRTVFRECVVSAVAARNIVVIKAYYGMANAACAAFDANHFDNVVGTLAGDDTVLVVMNTDESAIRLAEILKETLR